MTGALTIFGLSPVPTAFPVGFQPGVTHTKLTITVSFVDYATASTYSISFTDSQHNTSGSVSMAGLSDANPHVYVLNLIDTGDPFSDQWSLDFGTYSTVGAPGILVSGLVFS